MSFENISAKYEPTAVEKDVENAAIADLEKLNPDDLLEVKDFLLLQRVIKKINSKLDRAELLDQIVKDMSSTLGFTRCAVLLYDEDKDELEIAALTGWDDDDFFPGRRIQRDYGIVWKAVREQRIIYFADVLAHPEEIPCTFTSRSHIDVPLYHHDKLIGILNAQNIKVNAFSRHDMWLLRTLASHIVIAIENSKLYEIEKKEKEMMQKDLKEAKHIQSALFPKSSPDVQGFSLKGLCEPCQEVGGDWFDYLKLPSGKTGVVLADVSGKGLPGALLMSSARTVFRIVASTEDSPSQVLKKVNEYLIEDLPSTRFITMLYLVIDPNSNEILMANAGHMEPIHKCGNSVNEIEISSGLPLGIKAYDYKDNYIKLLPGEKLFLYSDGVSEALNAGGEFYSKVQIIESLGKNRADIYSVLDDLKSFAGNAPQSDDITMVEIEKLDA